MLRTYRARDMDNGTLKPPPRTCWVRSEAEAGRPGGSWVLMGAGAPSLYMAPTGRSHAANDTQKNTQHNPR